MPALIFIDGNPLRAAEVARRLGEAGYTSLDETADWRDAVRPGARLVVVRDGSFLGVVGPDEATVVRAAGALAAAAVWDEHDTLPDENDLDKFLRAGPHETSTACSSHSKRRT